MTTRRALELAAALALAGCGGGGDSSQASPAVPVVPPPTQPATQVPSEPATPTPAQPVTVDDATAHALGAASVDFGASVFRALASSTQGSFAVSPASLTIALGMTAEGARGATRDEMRTTLGASGLGDRLTPAIGAQLASWASVPGVELAVANRLYGERSYTFEQPFLDVTANTFLAPIERVDFLHDAEGARGTINAWVSERTRTRIPEILPSGSIDALVRLVLVNALYFRGDWQVQFDPSRTRGDVFHVDGGAEAPCSMMRREGAADFARESDAKVLRLPYAGGRIAAYFVLPNDDRPLASITDGLDGERLARWLAAPRPTENVDVQLPRFRIDPAGATPMNDVLRALGMRLAFERDHADFSGIARPVNPDDRLHVSAVFHRVFVEVEERGTEAAASTAVVMSVRGGRPGPTPERPVFRADRPFLFAIRDEQTGALSFVGRVSRP